MPLLKKLIRYTELADRKYIDTFLHYNVPLAQAELLFSHILNTQFMWVARIEETPQRYDRFHQHVVGDFETLHEQVMADMYRLTDEADLSRVVQYVNNSGEVYRNSIGDMLMNIVHHSTYHRGQVATQFKRHGIMPPVTDYIILARGGELDGIDERMAG